jgi:hypothetical protein
MSFNQFKLDRSSQQSRGIFNKYVYETDDDILTVIEPGYFSKSRFKAIDGENENSMGWASGYIEIKANGSYYFAQVTEDGNSVELVVESPNSTASLRITDDGSYRITSEGAYRIVI